MTLRNFLVENPWTRHYIGPGFNPLNMKEKLMKIKALIALFILAFATQAHAANDPSENVLDEFDPTAPNAQELLNTYDNIYRQETGISPEIGLDFQGAAGGDDSGCYRSSCKVWAEVVKSEQKLYLYVDGKLQAVWDTSTGVPGRDTPDFDKHPNGRIYDSYTSGAYPGGDYNGLGNMPYAVFIEGGYAIHGTGQGNWPKLGQVASHGCIRIHPDNAKIFNGLVRSAGINDTWVTVRD
jgi:hypothetical protein